MDIKRPILWILLTVSLVMLFENWQRDHGQASLFFSPITQQPLTSVSTDEGVSDLPPMKTGMFSATPPTHEQPMRADEKSGEWVHIKTDLYEIELDTLGGTLSRLVLKRPGPGKEHIILFDQSPTHTYLARTGLVDRQINHALPNHNDRFIAQPGPRELSPNTNTLTVRLDSPEKNGVKLIKTYTFTRGSYVIGVAHRVVNLGNLPAQPVLYMELVRDSTPVETPRFSQTFIGPVVYTREQNFQKISFSDLDKNKAEYIQQADNGWIAMVQHHFASAWIPEQGTMRELYAGKLNATLYRIGTKQALPILAPKQEIEVRARLFSGPEEERMLEGIAPGLELMKDYGWMTLIAKPLFWLLEKIHDFLGNWGWSIIVLTLLIKALFFPLSATSYRSMARMKEMTPRIQNLRERFKGEPQKMNAELMTLYRTEKINPFGGCLPILIQIPVFIALYWVLLSSVEMREAPWFGWIEDLSRQDPYFILPILMTASMFFQTRLNPTPADPVQAKMMLFMPLVFSAIFFFFPAGLVLYYVVNNVLSIAQQWVITRKISQLKK